MLPSFAVLLFCVARCHWLASLYECISIAGLITVTTLHPTARFARPFSFPPLMWLGSISYSVYVWQELFISFHSPLTLCLAMPVFVLVSYYCIERPATRLGHRLTNVRGAKSSAGDLLNPACDRLGAFPQFAPGVMLIYRCDAISPHPPCAGCSSNARSDGLVLCTVEGKSRFKIQRG
jgi:hypothetical protein